MKKALEQLQPYLDKVFSLLSAKTLFEWDSQTLAPSGSQDATTQIIGTLSDEYQKVFLDKDVQACYEKCKEEMEQGMYSLNERGVIKVFGKRLEELTKIPPQEFREYNELASRSGIAWVKAKEDNNFDAFAPFLEKIIDFKKRFASYRAKDGEELYDVLLNDYEEGFGMKELDLFFADVKNVIIPLLKKVTKETSTIDKSYNEQTYSIEKQREFCDFLATYIGLPKEYCVISESAHPFTLALHNKDVRITDHYYENNLESAMFSMIHEGGHALYELGVHDDITLTLAGGGASMGMHESQSRFYENNICKNSAFWQPIYQKLVSTYPEQLSSLAFDDFIRGINKATADYVRTEADELSYSLHILVRYEVEKMIFTEDISVSDLPRIWNEKYEEYLGITPPTDTLGILQDTHWSWGEFGYFPSYAIGSAVAAQIYAHMQKVLPMEDLLLEGKLSVIRDYLKEHVHQYGQTKTTNEMLMDMMGESFSPKYYMEYLKNKYEVLYHIST